MVNTASSCACGRAWLRFERDCAMMRSQHLTRRLAKSVGYSQLKPLVASMVLLLHCFHAASFPSHGEKVVISPAVPRSLDDLWLRRNGLAECIATEFCYALRVGANTHSNLMAPISVPRMMPFCFAQTNSTEINLDQRGQNGQTSRPIVFLCSTCPHTP